MRPTIIYRPARPDRTSCRFGVRDFRRFLGLRFGFHVSTALRADSSVGVQELQRLLPVELAILETAIIMAPDAS